LGDPGETALRNLGVVAVNHRRLRKPVVKSGRDIQNWSHPDSGIGDWGQKTETGIGCVRGHAERSAFIAVHDFGRRSFPQVFGEYRFMLDIMIGRDVYSIAHLSPQKHSANAKGRSML
jgi:hypothetical protein